MSTSPWSSGADSSSIWNSNSPNLNLLRRYSLRSSNVTSTKSTCSWEPSADNKYLVGYLVISRQDLEVYHAALGFQICGGKPTHDGQYGAIVEHVVPGSLMNIVCKLKVGDEIVEWNGFNLRNKRNDEVCDIIDSVKNANSLRLVAIRLNNNNNTSINTSSADTNSSSNPNSNTNTSISTSISNNTNANTSANNNNNSNLNTNTSK